MGLFSALSKLGGPKFTPEQEAFNQQLKDMHQALIQAGGFDMETSWEAIDARHESIMSFNAPEGITSMAITVSPSSLTDMQSGKGSVLVDLSNENDHPAEWSRIQDVVRTHTERVNWQGSSYLLSDLLGKTGTDIPRLDQHGAGVNGFWLWLPVTDMSQLQASEDFRALLAAMVQLGKQL